MINIFKIDFNGAEFEFITMNRVKLQVFQVYGLESTFIKKIPDERRQNGPFQNMEDLIKRT